MVSSSKRFLAIDLGAESGRAVVGMFDGQQLLIHEAHRFPNVPVRLTNTLHWDILRLWEEIQIGIGLCVNNFGIPHCIGVDTWGVDFGFLDQFGRLLANPIHYRDERNNGILEYAYAKVSKETIYQATGLQFLPINSLFQLLAAQREAELAGGSGLEPFQNATQMLFIPDLINYFLTGVRQVEYTIASTSQMLRPGSPEWATDLLAQLGLPTHFLSPVGATGMPLGPLHTSVIQRTHAHQTQVVASAGHDTAAAIAAVPANGSDWCYISSGTWSLMGVELPAPVVSETTLRYNFTNEGGVAGKTRLLKNIMGLWLVQQCRRGSEQRGEQYGYQQLADLAGQAKPFAALINPDHANFLNPPDMIAAITEFCQQTNQSVPTAMGGLIRCCLESLALKYRQTLAELEEVVGRKLSTIHIVGGGSRNELLCQMTADCCQRVVVAGPVEGTAIGNCLIQAMGCGDIASLEDIRQIVRQSSAAEMITYEPGPAGPWEEAYQRFLAFL